MPSAMRSGKRSAAGALAWEFRQRHRWGLMGLAAFLLVAAAVKVFVFDSGRTVSLDDAWGFAIVVVVPLTAAVTYVVAVFTFGLSGDVAARESMFPTRLYTLPMTTTALAFWPMLYGTVVMVVLWFTARVVGIWPSELKVPVVWPALMAAVILAWAQAFTWMPYGLRGLRVVVTLGWLTAVESIAMVGIHFQISEGLMVAFLAPQLPVAYLLGRVAVARARRGDVPELRWRPAMFRSARQADARPSQRAHFASSERAQAWFEWTRHGWSLPVLVGILLPFELALLFVVGDSLTLVNVILLGTLVTPPLMASFVGVTISKADVSTSGTYGLSPFMATRPLTSAALIAAKLRMTIWSTGAAWLLVVVAIPLAVVWSGTWPMLEAWVSRTREWMGTTRLIVVVLLVLLGAIGSTWKQLVQSLFVGLSGREWVNRTNAALLLSFLVALGPTLEWIHQNKSVQAAIWDLWPWIPFVLIAVKAPAGAWVATRLYQSRLLSDRALVTGAAVWFVAVVTLYATFVWLVDSPLLARHFLLAIAIAVIPLARLSAAPLALAWNRHR